MFVRFLTSVFIAAGLITGVLTLPVVAQDDPKYKTYQPTSRLEPLFEITFSNGSGLISFTDSTGLHSIAFDETTLAVAPGGVKIGSTVVFDDSGLVIDGIHRDYGEIHDLRIDDSAKSITITALTRTGASTRINRLKRGNTVKFSGAAIVDEDEFVRGAVLCITGDVEVYGEVNRDVVSLFGDIYVGPEAVVRGDMASVTGQIDVAHDASVYGKSYTAKEQRRSYRHRLSRHLDRFSTQVSLRYNRVDGFTAWWGQRYDGGDGGIPIFWGKVGYALASERWRFDLGIKQPLWSRRDLAFAGSYVRQLESDDDWVIDAEENSITSVLARRDYKDWWESERARLWLEAEPIRDLNVTVDYTYEETNWLDAHHNLWALFGGPAFEDNFAVVDSAQREIGIETLNESTNSSIGATLEYDTRFELGLLERSAWHISARGEWSAPGLDSDYDYSRYWLALRRYQEIDRRKMLLLRLIYAESDGDLPMHKRYYLGGIGTLRGYDLKEYTGRKYALGTVEVRQMFPRSDIAVGLHYDGGLIADQGDLGDSELKQSLGVSLWLGEDFKIDAARRLDRSYENGPELYARFSHRF